MLEPYKAPTAKTIVVDLKSSYLQAVSQNDPYGLSLTSDDVNEQDGWF